MNLIERDSWVVVEDTLGNGIIGRFTTLTETWVGLSDAMTQRGEKIGPAILPLANLLIIRPAMPGERDRSKGF